ncbi:unnamed protein product [Victoria cruziana]
MIFTTLEYILTHISFSIISTVIPTHLMTLVYEIVGLCDSSEKCMIATFFYMTGLLVTRWIYLGHSFSLIHIVPYFRNYTNYFSKIMAPSAILTQGFSTSVPTLQSHWLMMHVNIMLLSYAALLCGSLLSITLLVITFRRKIDIFSKTNHFLIKIIIGFTFLTIGILSRAVWANEAWGSYRNWDPKETLAFIIWTIFIIYLHTYWNK